jgi:hypothetical protein
MLSTYCQGGENILFFKYADFDNNGTSEAFGVIGDADVGVDTAPFGSRLYYVDDTAVKLIKSDIYGYPEFNAVDNGNLRRRFFVWEQTSGGRGSVSYVYGVKNGAAYELQISGKYKSFGVSIDSAGKFTAYSKDYGTAQEAAFVFQFNERTLEFEEVTAAITARPNATSVQLNGKTAAFNAYLINGNNYVMLRDFAYLMSGTAAQFDVTWDGAKSAINIVSGKAYTVVGGEMQSKGAGDKTPTPNASKIYLDGAEVALTAYTIEENNYFKLRDVAETLDFDVDWRDGKIWIEPENQYTDD